ncbi:MAG: hypothetical protein IJW67_10555 [Blautia sp.]|nr:hypothetical protein [Blautia sp.]
MSFQVSVRDSQGRAVETSALAKYVIENEEYYQKTRVIDQRIRRDFSDSHSDRIMGYYSRNRAVE